MTDPDRRGRCYELAALALINGDCPEGAVLVHGYPRLSAGEREGQVYGHAWLEWTVIVEHPQFEDCKMRITTVWDPVVDRRETAAIYYHFGRIDDAQSQRYDLESLRKMLMEHRHWGPWENIPEGAHFNQEEP